MNFGSFFGGAQIAFWSLMAFCQYKFGGIAPGWPLLWGVLWGVVGCLTIFYLLFTKKRREVGEFSLQSLAKLSFANALVAFVLVAFIGIPSF